jgi:hypothetical protein
MRGSAKADKMGVASQDDLVNKAQATGLSHAGDTKELERDSSMQQPVQVASNLERLAVPQPERGSGGGTVPNPKSFREADFPKLVEVPEENSTKLVSEESNPRFVETISVETERKVTSESRPEVDHAAHVDQAIDRSLGGIGTSTDYQTTDGDCQER